MSANRKQDTLRLAAKLILFAGVSALLTTVVVTSVLDLNLKSSTTYHAVFTNVTGLQSGDTVRIAGVEVGKVGGVHLLTGPGAARCGSSPPARNCAVVTFDVASGQHLTTTTRAQVDFANLLGQRFLALLPGNQGGSRLGPGGTIPRSQTQPGLDLTAVFDGFQPLFNALTPDEVNQLAYSIIQVFQGQSGTVASLVAETAAITNNLADRQQLIDQVLQNLAGLLNAVNGQGTQLGQLIGNFDSLVKGLAGERSQLGNTISGLGNLNTELAGVLQQSQPTLNQSISQLASATGTLENNQAGIDGVINGLPPVLNALTKVVSSGNYAQVYICNLTVNIRGTINISLVPGVPAPQNPVNLQLPSGSIGDQSQHTRNCT